MTSDGLTGREAVVTGGTRGIGAAIARRLRALGASVTVTGRSREGSAPAGCIYRAVDLADTTWTESFARELSGTRVDVLINNAGINAIAPFEDISPDDFDRIQRVNVRGPMLLCRAVLPGMRGRRWGRIVNIGSIYGVISREQRGSYSASKFALDGLTAALAAEVARDGILANCVSPGFVETDLTGGVLGEEGMARVARQIPMGRLAQPDEIAGVVGWLAGPDNTYLSGQNIVIDGGFSRV